MTVDEFEYVDTRPVDHAIDKMGAFNIDVRLPFQTHVLPNTTDVIINKNDNFILRFAYTYDETDVRKRDFRFVFLRAKCNSITYPAYRYIGNVKKFLPHSKSSSPRLYIFYAPISID